MYTPIWESITRMRMSMVCKPVSIRATICWLPYIPIRGPFREEENRILWISAEKGRIFPTRGYDLDSKFNTSQHFPQCLLQTSDPPSSAGFCSLLRSDVTVHTRQPRFGILFLRRYLEWTDPTDSTIVDHYLAKCVLDALQRSVPDIQI